MKFADGTAIEYQNFVDRVESPQTNPELLAFEYLVLAVDDVIKSKGCSTYGQRMDVGTPEARQQVAWFLARTLIAESLQVVTRSVSPANTSDALADWLTDLLAGKGTTWDNGRLGPETALEAQIGPGREPSPDVLRGPNNAATSGADRSPMRSLPHGLHPSSQQQTED